MSSRIYDTIIIGSGPAGLTAAIYASRMKMSTLMLESSLLGGRAVYAPMVENFPGFPDGITGTELTDRMIRQAEKFGAEIKAQEEVLDLSIDKDLKNVVTQEGKYQSYSIVIATGTQHKKLRVPGETEYLGRGVSYCAVCDGPLYKNKITAVIGFSDYTLEDALYLSNLAKKVIIVTQKDQIEATETLVDKASKKPNIEVLKAKVSAVLGDSVVKAIQISDSETGKEKDVYVDGVFISIGGSPMTSLVRKLGIEIDENGCIKVNMRQATNIDGVFAAGDCTCGGMQIITAAGEGATAAIQAYRYSRKYHK